MNRCWWACSPCRCCSMNHHHRFDQHTLSSGYGGGGKNGCCLFIKIGQRAPDFKRHFKYTTLARVHGNTNSLLSVCNHGNLDRRHTVIAQHAFVVCVFSTYPSVRVLNSLHSFLVNAFSFSFTILGSPTKIERERALTKERTVQDVSSLFSFHSSSSPFSSSVRRASCWLFAAVVIFVVVFPHFIHSTFCFLSHRSLSLFHSFTVCHSRVCTLKAFSDAPRLHFLQRCYFVLLSRSLAPFPEIIAAHLRHFLNELLSLLEWLAHTHTPCFIKLHKLVYGGQSYKKQHLF